MKYSVDRLYKDIVAQYVKERDSEDFILRDVQHYLKVFCYIISVAREVESGKDYEEKTVIENMLNNDNSLFSYTFFFLHVLSLIIHGVICVSNGMNMLKNWIVLASLSLT